MKTNAYYPLFADLHGRRCVVVGGGPIAQRKVSTLLGYGAEVAVVSPTATRRLLKLARAGRIRYVARRFRPQDLRGMWLVHAGTQDPTGNELVFRAAQRLRIFTNVVDQKPLCSFIAPAIFRRGAVTIAVSTGGASPTIAKRLRHELGQLVGAEYVPMLRLLTGLRAVAKRTLPRYGDRKRYFDHLVSGRVFALVRAGKTAAAKREALALLGQTAGRNGH